MTAVRALHTRQGRRKAGRFLVEGPQAVRAALAAGVVIRDLLVDDELTDGGPDGAAAGSAGRDLAEAAASAGVPVTWVSSRALDAMAETAHPQGVLAVCDLLPQGDLAAALAGSGPVVVLDAVTDPGNVGTVIRTADAVGAAAVLLTPGCADVHNGKVVRATAGSLFHVPVLAGLEVATIVDAARAEDRGVAVATGDASTDLFSAVDDGTVSTRTVWIVGSEAHGVSRAARDGADVHVRIPMAGRTESLNAAVAAAVVLYVTAHGTARATR